jgi:hypothetical protein
MLGALMPGLSTTCVIGAAVALLVRPRAASTPVTD